MCAHWLQIHGDPAIRQFLFEQERVPNDFDRHLDEVLERTEQLLREHAIFHAKIHFSSGQVTLWLLDDPLRYRVHVKDEFLDSGLCLVYPRKPYTSLARMPADVLGKVLALFKRLRTHDRHIYLRSGSLNIVNGKVGLNFSCDGTHYLDYTEFLASGSDLCGA
jgi:hypothetical protein